MSPQATFSVHRPCVLVHPCGPVTCDGTERGRICAIPCEGVRWKRRGDTAMDGRDSQVTDELDRRARLCPSGVWGQHACIRHPLQ